jgi:DNA-binding response OmpR family regulator
MSGKHILAFEPDPLYAKMLQDEFGARGHTVEVVSDGAVGLERAAASPPDLIYLCIELPRISGFSVCNKLRKNPETETIPLIITSAEATEDVFEKHKKLKARADEYLLKPFGEDKLVPMVERLLKGSGVLLEEEGGLDLETDDSLVIESDEEVEEVEEIEEVSGLIDASASVDKEVEALTDAAFDAISIDDEKPKAAPAPKAEPAPAAKPAAGADPAELKKARAEAESLKDHVARLERQLAESKSAKGGGVSSREFLDLRELLNKKDRELLDLKDSVNSKEKQLLEHRERITDLERSKADLDDKNITAEKQINELQGKVEDLLADKEVAHKKAEDLQNRIENQQAKIESVERELDGERAARRADVERLGAEKDAEVRRTVGEKEDEKKRALADLAAEMERERASALEGQEAELKVEADKHREVELTEQRLRHEAATEELREALAMEKDAALADQDKRHADKIQALEDKQRHELGELKSRLYDNEQKIQNLETELEETKATLAEAREELAATQSLLDQRTNEEAAAKAALAETQEKLEVASRDLQQTSERLMIADAKVEGLTADLADRDGRVATLSGDLDEANETIGRSDAIVTKARQALEIASKLLADLGAEE